MKKFLVVLGILFISYCGLLTYYNSNLSDFYDLNIEEDRIKINNLHIYGTHLNISGDYNFLEYADLVLYNGEFTSYPIYINNNTFNLSSYINDGMYLDNIKNGTYYMFLRIKYLENEKENYKYYAIKNDTEYKETIYYTMSNYDKKIVINSKNKYDTLMLNVTNNRNKNVYDVVIDPGHGGKDSGACRYNYCETDLNMNIALKIKSKLEDYGMKVKLTHEEGQLKESEKLEEYGVHGRAVIPYEVNAKYVFSIHLNSANTLNINGLEVYTAKNINYDFARLLANNIVSITKTNYSNSIKNKIYDGIYSRNFTLEDINTSLKEYKKEDLNPYDVTTKSNYYYMIRETGGIITGAYVDDRNEKILANPYVKSNVGVETYLLELGYLSNKDNLNHIINNEDKYVDAIATSIKTLYSNN